MRNYACVTLSTKLRDFQYRLLHKRIPTNRELYRWKIKATPNCAQCGELDSIKHALFDCRNSAELWNEYAIYLAKRFPGVIFKVEFVEVIFNCVHPNYAHVSNLMCLIMKQLIYRGKCLREHISFATFINELERVRQYELSMAIKTNRVQKHNRKWDVESINNGFEQENNSSNDGIDQFIQQYIDNM